MAAGNVAQCSDRIERAVTCNHDPVASLRCAPGCHNFDGLDRVRTDAFFFISYLLHLLYLLFIFLPLRARL
jgi:hypothetical protein